MRGKKMEGYRTVYIQIGRKKKDFYLSKEQEKALREDMKSLKESSDFCADFTLADMLWMAASLYADQRIEEQARRNAD